MFIFIVSCDFFVMVNWWVLSCDIWCLIWIVNNCVVCGEYLGNISVNFLLL